MNDIVTAATKVAKRLRDDDEDPSPSEIASAVDEASSDDQNTSALEQYAKKAALIGAVSLVQRYLSDEGQQGMPEDATRVEVVDPDERVKASDTSESTEESSGGLFSLKRVLFLGALVGVGYAAVKKLRSKGDQHTLEEWEESASADTDTATVGESDAGEADVDIGAGVADESEDEGVSDHDVDIGAGEADDESNATTDPTEVADGEPLDADEDESSSTDSIGADPDEVAVEEGEDEDEDERVSQSE